MNKRELTRRVTGIIKQMEALQSELEGIDFSVMDELESVKDEIEENVDSIKSAELRSEWENRVGDLDSIWQELDELKDHVSDKVGELIESMEELL